jgi:hypothetical protein
MKAAALTAPLTGEPAPADLPINGIWLTQGSVRLTRLETWTGDGKLYIDVDGGGTLALDTGAVLLLALRLVSELGRMPIGRLCRRALQEAPRVLALLALRMRIDLIIYGGPPPMPDHPPLMPVGVGPQRGRRVWPPKGGAPSINRRPPMKRDYRWLWELPPPLPRRWPLLLDLWRSRPRPHAPIHSPNGQ